MYDLIIRNGMIIDGTGSPGYLSDIAVKDGKIAAIEETITDCARLYIEAGESIVCPGFIDFHSHSDINLMFESRAVNMLQQGITTEISGQCGMSLAPRNASSISSIKAYVSESKYEEVYAAAETVGSYLDYIEQRELGTNIVFLVGHGALRAKVMGYDNRRANDAELDAMKTILRKAMESGAKGMSSGLIYPPGVYADEEELKALCQVVAEYGGLYTTHMRNESFYVERAVEEVIRIAETTGVNAVISHHKVAGKACWGRAKKTLALIESARSRGIAIHCDQYPYRAGATSLISAIPPQFASEGPDALIKKLADQTIRDEIVRQISEGCRSFENLIYLSGIDGVMISGAQKTPWFNRMTLAGIAKEKGVDPFDALFEILIDNNGLVDAVFFMMDERDVKEIVSQPYVMGGTDAGHVSEKCLADHPRFTGSFIKILSQYALKEGCFTLEEGIRKLTGLPAQVAGLRSKGRVASGYDADLVIFDANQLKSFADFTNPQAPNSGLKYVIVNGQLAVENDHVTGCLAGQLIRRK